MEELTVEQARDRLAETGALLHDGSISAYVMKDGSTPVAKTALITAKRPFGLAHEKPFLVDEEAFDAPDEVIAADFGLRSGIGGHASDTVVSRRTGMHAHRIP